MATIFELGFNEMGRRLAQRASYLVRRHHPEVGGIHDCSPLPTAWGTLEARFSVVAARTAGVSDRSVRINQFQGQMFFKVTYHHNASGRGTERHYLISDEKHVESLLLDYIVHGKIPDKHLVAEELYEEWMEPGVWSAVSDHRVAREQYYIPGVDSLTGNIPGLL